MQRNLFFFQGFCTNFWQLLTSLLSWLFQFSGGHQPRLLTSLDSSLVLVMVKFSTWLTEQQDYKQVSGVKALLFFADWIADWTPISLTIMFFQCFFLVSLTLNANINLPLKLQTDYYLALQKKKTLTINFFFFPLIYHAARCAACNLFSAWTTM